MYVDYSYAAPFPNTEKKEVPQYTMEKTQIILIQMTFLSKVHVCLKGNSTQLQT